jgi:hypothetical protein
MKFAVALSKFFRLADETTGQFAAQIKALTPQDKVDLHAIMVKEGHDVEPPMQAAG